MGNSCHAVRGLWLLKNKDCSLHLQLGKSASIDLKGGEIEHKSDGKVTETWRLSYTVEGSSCTFTLVKTTGGPRPEELEAYIMDNIRKNIKGNIEEHSFIFRDTAEIAGWNGLLCEHAQDSSVRISSPTDEGKEKLRSSKYIPDIKKATYARGDATKTTLITEYGTGTRKSLFVREWKKKSEDKKTFTSGTLAHYFVNTSSKTDIGLSVMIRIGLSNGCLDYAVDGPVQHPSSALLYMFEQVSRTQTWNPTACPHCADIRKQRSMFLHFETDQTESSEDSDNFPPPRCHGATQNAGSVLANDGVIKGNNNGNFNVRRFIFGGRR